MVFDNCEHVLGATAQLVERLLRSAPALRVVATSREALLIGGEQVMPLGPLSMDEHDGHPLMRWRCSSSAAAPRAGRSIRTRTS